MNQIKFSLRPNTKGIILHKPVIDLHACQTQIRQLPTARLRRLAYFKRFYKLRKFEPNPIFYSATDVPYYTPELDQTDYVQLLKRSFTAMNYNVKRQAILNLPPLSEEELEERMMNTLAFVFNHTVAENNPHANDPIYTEDDLHQTSIDTMESKIVGIMLRMDNEMPSEIKFDPEFKWLKDLDNHVANVDWEKSRIPKSKNSPWEYIGYKQYFITLMRLNESLKLCL
ncbi:hypothetical protein SBY92_003668 [Candida maltosa Xu316]|uniref:Uncharacterized protein n=1 Tax=Candida maltosa (strain Xu316) TaxID=1245528 RepID=M3HRN8_CANMX|nr:hypothetical protein G210_4775 [Candida maltosa Xu316]